MVRQLQPLLHLETSQEVVETLQGKVPEVRMGSRTRLASGRTTRGPQHPPVVQVHFHPLPLLLS